MIISEKELSKILIKENNEVLVDIAKFDNRIQIMIPKYMKNTGLKRILVRKGVAEKLKSIQNELPEDMNLILTSGVRPLNIQKEIFNSFLKKIKKDHPNWTEDKIREETRKIVAPPDSIPPHSTGGAIDLTIYKNKKPLDMGCEIPLIIDVHNPDINKFPTNIKDITKEQRKNREFLINVMEKQSFVNLKSEWWHWSYGDRYWAVKKNKIHALYGPIESI